MGERSPYYALAHLGGVPRGWGGYRTTLLFYLKGWKYGWNKNLKPKFSETFTGLILLFLLMVPQRGLEPPANGLGNRCSILLSYWGIIFKLSRAKAAKISDFDAGLSIPTLAGLSYRDKYLFFIQ